MSSGGGSGSDGGNDMQVSGMEAAISKEKGISTHADTRTSSSSYSGGEGPHDQGGVHNTGLQKGEYAGVTPSMSSINPKTGKFESGGFVDAEDEYLEPDKDHWIATQKAIGKTNKELRDKGLDKSDWTDWTKEQQDAYQLEMNKLKGTEGKRYSFYKGNEGTTNLSFGEHWKDAVVKHPALKFSVLGRFLYTAGQTLGENLTTDYGTWRYGAKEGTGSGRPVDGGGWLGLLGGSGSGDNTNVIGDREAMNIIAPHAPYIVSGTQPPPGGSPAADWYASLGKSSTSGFQFSFSDELKAAKAKQAGILGKSSAVGQLAVNQSPFYNWLKQNKLDRGIL